VYNFSNSALATTLNGDITDTATSLVVVSATGYPDVPFKIKIDTEIIVVGAKTGVTFSSLERGHEDSVATAHSNTDEVIHVVTAEDIGTVDVVKFEPVQLQQAWFTSNGTINSNMINNRPDYSSYYTDVGTAPKWMQVDLQSLMPVTRVKIVPYFGDGRRYKDVKIEVSEDDVAWETVFDVTGEAMGGAEGYAAMFPLSKQIRYVKYTCTSGSTSNTTVHIVEFMVWRTT